MNAGAPVAKIVLWSAFGLWVAYGVIRDYRRYRRLLRERPSVVTPCEFRRSTPPLVLGAPPAHPRARRPR